MTNKRGKFISPGRLALAAALLLPLIARADFNAADWQYYKVIQTPAPGADGFVGVAINESIYDHAAPGLRDLRVVADGREVPYVLAIQSGLISDQAAAPRIVNQAVVPGGRQEFILDLGGRGVKNNQVEIVSPSQNFKRPVAVYGSDDAAEWKLLRDGFYIFDFSGDVSVRDLVLRYPENIFQFLKVEIGLDGGESIEIGSVIMSNREVQNQVRVKYEALGLSFTQKWEIKATNCEIDFNKRKLPINRLVFTVDAPEFYRRVEVFSDKDFKRKIGEGVIHRYRVGEFTSEQLAVTFQEELLSAAYARIYNHDNEPLSVKNVIGSGWRRVIIFRPPPGEVRLYYGKPKAQASVYDLAQLYPHVREKTPELGSFAPEEQINPAYVAPLPPEKPRDYKLLLWLILIPAGALLVFLVLRSLKEMDGNRKEGPGE